MRLLIVVAAIVLCGASPPQSRPCGFQDVVRAPDNAPAVLDRTTPLKPDLSRVLLPVRSTDVTVWLRVSADGDVTDACAPDAADDIRAALVAAALQLRYTPAIDRGRKVATVVAVRYEIEGRLSRRGLQEQIGLSDDVAMLERIAGSLDEATQVWRRQRRRIGSPKDLRILAYARLGAIGTPESLAAQKRIAAAFADRSLAYETVNLAEPWSHPGWHMSDARWHPLAQFVSGRSRMIVLALDLLGPWQLFVSSCNAANSSVCFRPKPFATWHWRYTKVDATLEEISAGHLRLRIVPVASIQPSIMDGTAPVAQAPMRSAGPETFDIILPHVERDADSDGWTDLEEEALGLNPERKDSDADGIDDGRDRAPLYAPSKGDGSDDESAILQAAIFSVFGVTESRWVLFAKYENIRQIEVPGLSAPVLFNRPLRFDPKQGGPGGVFVTWKIARKSATEAIVEMTDWEGPLAAGGQDIHLRRINNDWIVIARQTTWIS